MKFPIPWITYQPICFHLYLQKNSNIYLYIWIWGESLSWKDSELFPNKALYWYNAIWGAEKGIESNTSLKSFVSLLFFSMYVRYVQ